MAVGKISMVQVIFFVLQGHPTFLIEPYVLQLPFVELQLLRAKQLVWSVVVRRVAQSSI